MPETPKTNQRFQGMDPRILLWEIGIDDKAGLRDLATLLAYLRKRGSLTGPLSLTYSELSELKLPIKTNPLLRELIRSGHAIIGSADFRLQKRIITTVEVPAYLDELSQIYTRMQQECIRRETRYPAGAWTEFESGILQTIPLEKIPSVSMMGNSNSKKVLEIRFPNDRLPRILTSYRVWEKLQATSFDKLVLHLSDFAGESEEFYSDTVKHIRTLITTGSGTERELNTRIAAIKRPTGREYRKEYAAIVLEQALNSESLLEEVLELLDIESNRHIITKFAYDNPAAFDFLQAMELSRAMNTSTPTADEVTPATLERMVALDSRNFITEEELKHALLDQYPDLPEENFKELYHAFEERFIEGESPEGTVKVIRFEHLGSTGGPGLVHTSNIHRLLDDQLQSASRQFSSALTEEWTHRIERYDYLPEMFSAEKMNEKIRTFLREKHTLLYSLCRSDTLYKALRGVDPLSPVVSALLRHRLDRIDKVFGLESASVYSTAVTRITQKKSMLGRLLFLLFHWFTRWNYEQSLAAQTLPTQKSTVPQNGSKSGESATPRSGATPASGDPRAVQILAASDTKSENELRSRLDELWNALPGETLDRESITRNILSDLTTYLSDKDDVPISGLEYIVPVNVNRILAKAEYLKGYTGPLTEFVRKQMYMTLLRNPHLRSKCRLSI